MTDVVVRFPAVTARIRFLGLYRIARTFTLACLAMGCLVLFTFLLLMGSLVFAGALVGTALAPVLAGALQ